MIEKIVGQIVQKGLLWTACTVCINSPEIISKAAQYSLNSKTGEGGIVYI